MYFIKTGNNWLVKCHVICSLTGSTDKFIIISNTWSNVWHYVTTALVGTNTHLKICISEYGDVNRKLISMPKVKLRELNPNGHYYQIFRISVTSQFIQFNL